MVDPPSSAQHVENTHTGEGNVHMTTSVPHATTMTMQHTCPGFPSRHLNTVLQFVWYCGNTEHSSSQCHNRPWDNREQPCSTLEALRNQEFQCANGEIWEIQAPSHKIPKDGPVNHICRGCTAKFWEIPVHINHIIMQVPIFLGETRTTMMVTKEGHTSFRFWQTFH